MTRLSGEREAFAHNDIRAILDVSRALRRESAEWCLIARETRERAKATLERVREGQERRRFHL